MQSPLLDYANAIAQIESGGDYGTVGPTTKTGDKAYGKYQVMGSNVPSWTKIATGTSMSPSDFLKDPDAQDQVFNTYFGGALNKYGNPQDAASVWFSGKPYAQGQDKSDGYNTGKDYVSKFNAALAQQQQQPSASQADPETAMAQAFASQGQPPAASPAPGSPNAMVANDFSQMGGPNSPAQTPASTVANAFAGLGGPNSPAQTPATRVANGFDAMNMTPNARVAQGFDAMNGAAPGAPQDITPDAQLPPNSTPTSGTTGGGDNAGIMSALGGMGTALQGAGGSLMAISNPSGGAALMDNANKRAMEIIQAKQMMKPTWSKTGQDIYGRDQYGWTNPMNQTVTPANGTGGVTAAGASGTPDDPVSSAISSGKNGEDLLAQPGIPSAVASVVRGISDGSQQYNPGTMLRTPIGREVMALLPAYEPGASGADFAGREAGMKDWATKSAELTRRASNAATHGGDLVDSFQALNNGPVPAINAVTNAGKQYLTGDGSITAAKQNIFAFANEMGALTRGNGGSDAAASEWANSFPVNGSPDQQRAAIGKGAQLFGDMLDNLNQKRLSSVGAVQAQKLGPLVPQKVTDSLQKMKDYASGADQQQAQPSSQSTTQTPGSGTPSATKQIGGKNYYQIGNQWYTE